jgi:hypothetical protein
VVHKLPVLATRRQNRGVPIRVHNTQHGAGCEKW